MTAATAVTPRSRSAGFTLVEVMIALVILAIGIMAFAEMFPAGQRAQVKGKMDVTAAQYINEEFETLRGLAATSGLLAAGKHPAVAFDSLGTSKAWRRYYVVTQMPAPLDDLLKVDCTVLWQGTKPDSIRMTGYLLP